MPDEGRTFGLESAIRQVGIYASEGQKYKPHDVDMLLYYREEQDGQILEEGITEAGSMASFTAAGTAYSNYRVPMIPFYMYYSMFGFQRIGDMIWAFADSRGKGFLMGGTAGRTTMLGEGLQHQDGHSIVLASTVPTCVTYDPAYVYELAVILQDGLRRMYEKSETSSTTSPCTTRTTRCRRCRRARARASCAASIVSSRRKRANAVAQLFGSGPILNEVAARAADPRGKVQRGHRRVERDQLQRAAARCPRGGTLESPASLAEGEAALHSECAGQRGRARSSPPATT